MVWHCRDCSEPATTPPSLTLTGKLVLTQLARRTPKHARGAPQLVHSLPVPSVATCVHSLSESPILLSPMVCGTSRTGTPDEVRGAGGGRRGGGRSSFRRYGSEGGAYGIAVEEAAVERAEGLGGGRLLLEQDEALAWVGV